MALTNCSRCGNVYDNAKGDAVCLNCMMKENMDIKKVTDYLRKNPLAGVMDVNRDTGVSQSLIFRLVKSGSLQIRSVTIFKCRLCGKDIKQGTTCSNCSSKIDGMNKKK
jgi:DNA-directed RNA polymerase subunit RPC12/RpoP